jgi:hypothetical protein
MNILEVNVLRNLDNLSQASSKLTILFNTFERVQKILVPSIKIFGNIGFTILGD